jgi:hypothetical protein
VGAVSADELDGWLNTFRDLCGRDQCPPSAGQRDAQSFMDTLKRQVGDYMEEAKADMKAAGFKTTPWDNMGPRS